MKTKLTFTALVLLALPILNFQPSTAFAQGTAFIYQGRLNSGGAAANGSYDIALALFATNTSGVAIAGPVTNAAVPVANGLFTTTVDFGNVFTGGSNWLEIAVSTNGANSFFTLSPRQQLTPVPYAITAANVSGTIASASLAGTYGSALNFSNANNSFTGGFSGSFSGNGSSVSNVNAAALNGLNAANFWQLGGNNVAPGQFLGSTNGQPVEIRANGQRALRVEPDASASGAPNVIGGSSANYVTVNKLGPTHGAVIGGGGATNDSYYGQSFTNVVAANYSTIAGGGNNTVSQGATTGKSEPDFSFIGGGLGNTASEASTIGGGQNNTAGAPTGFATVGGGYGNTANNDGAFVGGGGYDGGSILKGGNSALGAVSAVVGGMGNSANNTGAFVGGGGEDIFTIHGNTASGLVSVVAGGYGNTASGVGAFVGGGGDDEHFSEQGNTASGGASAIVGGLGNNVSGDYSAIGGGNGNSIQLSASNSVISGGTLNTNGGYYSTIGGGELNAVIGIFSAGAAIGGGGSNTISANFSTIAGGAGNTVSGKGYAAIGGGFGNTISSTGGTIGGGFDNAIEGVALGATISGGYLNTNLGFYAVVPGGRLNLATGTLSLAAGYQAQATNQGAFVWADSQNAPFASTNNDSFNVRAQGGVRFVTGGAGMTVDGVPALSGTNLMVINSTNSVMGGGSGNVLINATDSVIAGGQDNTNGGSSSSIGGGEMNLVVSGSIAETIGGGSFNSVWGENDTIAGGNANSILGLGSGETIGGGVFNTNAGNFSVIGGGKLNLITAAGGLHVIAGGLRNSIAGGSGAASAIGGGSGNYISINSGESTIGGGFDNTNTADYATIPGGYENLASGRYGFAAGHEAQSTNQGAFVWSDSQLAPFASTNNDSFNVRAQGGVFFVTSGAGLTVDGQPVLTSASSTFWKTGGNSGTSPGANYLGTSDNQALELHVDGGRAFRLEPTVSGTGVPNVIGGWSGNLEDNSSQGVTIGGGGASGFVNHVSSSLGAIAGGSGNVISTNANDSTIGGGRQNTIDLNSWGGVIGGGHGNWIQMGNSSAGGSLGNPSYSVIGGGYGNVVGTNINNATIGGGGINTNNGSYATIPGGFENLASGSYAFAAGQNAQAIHTGAFVWSDDSTSSVFASTNNNSFSARAAGGFQFYTSSSGRAGAGLYVPPGGNSWVTISDRNAKKDFAPVDYQAVLEKLVQVPIEQWHYQWESEQDTLNIGPMAQDFIRAFYPGRDDKGISTLEFDGVELAAIQGLNEKLEGRSQKAEIRIQNSETRIQALETENTELKAQVTDLQSQLESLQKAVARLAAKSGSSLALNTQSREAK